MKYFSLYLKRLGVGTTRSNCVTSEHVELKKRTTMKRLTNDRDKEYHRCNQSESLEK